MILYSIVDPKLADLYTLSHSKLLENHTLHSGTYLYVCNPRPAPKPEPGASNLTYSCHGVSHRPVRTNLAQI